MAPGTETGPPRDFAYELIRHGEGGDPLDRHWELRWGFTAPDGRRHGGAATGNELLHADPPLMDIVREQMARAVRVAWESAQGRH